VTVDVKLDGDRVADFAHEVKACALGQASSSIMARHVVGATVAELRALRDQMHAMLKQGGDPPAGKWAELEALTPVRDFKPRHASTLLTFDATVEAAEMALAKEAEGSV
jgi:NifU-like protein involved in Fe-S cluster formation